MTYRPLQVVCGFALDDYGVETQTGHSNFADHLAFPQNTRVQWNDRLHEFFLLRRLIRFRIGGDIAHVAQGGTAEGEKKVASPSDELCVGRAETSPWPVKQVHFAPVFRSAEMEFTAATTFGNLDPMLRIWSTTRPTVRGASPVSNTISACARTSSS